LKPNAWIFIAFLTVAGCGVVPLTVNPVDPTAPPPLRPHDAELKPVVERWFGIWSDDPEANAKAEAMYAPDADALFFNGFLPVGGTFGPRGYGAEARRKARARFESFEVEPREGQWLRRNGDHAVISIPFHVKMRAKGRSGETFGASSLVIERRQGQWKILHEHTSFVLLPDWLGGIDPDLDMPPRDRTHPGDHEFQLLIDAYLTELDASRTADLARSNAPSRYYAPDLDVIVWDPTARRPLLGWTGVAANRDAFDLRISMTNKQSRQDVHAWKSGDWAWATFTFTARATRRNGDRFEVVGRQTDVFQEIDGRWRIVHEHASIPYDADGTPAIRSEIVLARATPGTTRSVPRLPVVVPAVSVVDAAADHETFGRLLEDYATAWSTTQGKLDWPRTLRMYAPEGEVNFYQSKRDRRLAMRSLEEKREADYGGGEITVTPGTDLHVTRNGNVAWTTNTIEVRTVNADGESEQRTQYMTAVWERRGATWVIVDEHLSPGD
jgi:ketosteroid isomerase-like protein